VKPKNGSQSLLGRAAFGNKCDQKMLEKCGWPRQAHVSLMQGSHISYVREEEIILIVQMGWRMGH